MKNTSSTFSRVSILKNNNAQVKEDLWYLRSKDTSREILRRIVENLTTLLIYISMSKHKLTQKKVVTPNGIFSIEKILDNEPCFIPVLRAGVFMLPGALKIFPNASVDFIGIGRDHNTLEPKEYLDLKGVPSSKDKTYYILDPMVATGGSIIYVIDKLKKIGIQDKNIRILCIFTCPEGIIKIRNKYPNIHISCVTIDKKLNEQGYIIPGLGDAGKRLSGTNS